MLNLKTWKAVLLCAGFLFVPRAGQAQGGETFRARLATVPVDASMMSTVAGHGSLTASLAGKTLTLSGKFEGLRSPATTAQIHLAPKGLRGPVLFELAASKAMQGTIEGKIELTGAQIEDLKNGHFYVQLQSEGAPDGNLWGWILH